MTESRILLFLRSFTALLECENKYKVSHPYDKTTSNSSAWTALEPINIPALARYLVARKTKKQNGIEYERQKEENERACVFGWWRNEKGRHTYIADEGVLQR